MSKHTHDPQAVPFVKWEYCMLDEFEVAKLGGYSNKEIYNLRFFAAGLNCLGDSGWEWVEAIRRDRETYYIFKRPKVKSGR